jgi:hypothetical protein
MPAQQPPLKLKTTAFCKTVLTEIGSVEHSLIGFLPAIQLGVQFPEGERAKQPKALMVPFYPGLCAFALFERTTPLDESFEVEVQVRVVGPFAPQPEASSVVSFLPGVRYSQMPIKLGNPVFQFDIDKNYQETEIKVEWLSEGKSLGVAALPVALKILEPATANK